MNDMLTTQPIFRVFVSSTFSDFEIEREVLREVWANLQSFCASRGASFQEVDLRWGISPESANSHETLQICLDEIQRCQQLSPKPNFIILMGDRYGWRPVPPSIPDVDYNKIKECAKADEFNINLLETWYRRDENAIPPNYALKTIKGNPEQWQTDEPKLAAFLREAANKLQLDDELYQHSATHREIVKGLLENPESRDHVFCFKRTIINLPEISDGDAKKFSDFIDGSRDADAANLLTVLHDKIENSLPDEQTYIYKADWHEDTSQISYNHLTSLKSDVERCLTGIIDKQLSEITQTDPLDIENEAHRNFAMVTSRNLFGRESDIKIIYDYITSAYETSPLTPLIVSSPAGYGKSALISKLFLSEPISNAVVIGRFIGATPCSWSPESFLINMISQIEHSYGQQDTQLSGEKTLRELTELFSARLRLASSDKPMILLIDALDQFTGSSSQVITSVIPRELPQHVALVCSFLYDDTSEYLDHIKNLYPNMKHHALAGLTPQNCEDILDSGLENYKRKVTIQQKKQLLKNACGSPLYTTLLIQKARRLHHNEEIEDLPSEPTELAEKLVLSLAKRHYELLTIRALGYIKAARFGLSERELLEVLWNDVDVRIEFKEYCKKINQPEPNSALPLIVWSRIYAELETYINEFSMDGELLLRFFHRLFGDVAEELNRDVITKLHSRLADYFGGQEFYNNGQPNARKVMELSFQLLKAGKLHEAEKSITNFDFAMTKCQLNHSDDWVNDFNMLIPKLEEIKPDTKVWHSFVQENAHILRRGNDMWPAHKILLQLAIEHANDSPLAIEAEQFLSNDKCDWLWLRRELRVEKVGGVSNCLAVMEGHKDGVSGVLSLPEGRALSWSDDGALRLWTLKDGQCCTIMKGHIGGIEGVHLLPNDLALSWSNDGSLRIWNLIDGQCQTVMEGHKSFVRGVHLLPDGRALSWSSSDKTLRLWNLNDGRCQAVMEGHTEWFGGVHLIPNGQALSWSDDGTLRLWNLFDGRCIAVMKDHTDWVLGVSLLPDSRCLSWSSDETLRLWNLNDRKCRAVMEGHRSEVTGVNILPNGRVLLCSKNHTLSLWDLISGKCLAVMRGHTDSIGGVHILLDDRALSWSNDGTLRIWRLEDGQNLAILEGHIKAIAGVHLLPEDRVLSWSNDGTLRLWSLESGQNLSIMEGHVKAIKGAHLLPGDQALSWSWDKTLRLWNLVSGKCLAVMRGHTDSIEGVQILLDGRALSWSLDNSLRLWNLVGEQHQTMLEGHTEKVRGIKHLPDGRALSWADDGNLRLWNLDGGQCLSIIEGHKDRIEGVHILHDGRALSWSWDNTIRLWNLNDGRQLAVLKGHVSMVHGVHLISDEKALSWSNDCDLRLWSLKEGQCLAVMEGHMNRIRGVHLLPDGQALSWSTDSVMNLWNLEKGQRLAALKSQVGPVRGIQILSDGRVVFWSNDCVLRLWSDLLCGQCQAVMEGHTDQINGVNFLPGERVISWSDDGTLRLWDLKNGHCLAVYEIKKLFSAPTEIWQSYLSKDQLISTAGIHCIGHTLLLGYEHKNAMHCLHWHGASECTAHHLIDDGRLIATQSNGQVCFLRAYQGKKRVTILDLC